MTRSASSASQHPTTTIFEFEGFVWCNGDGGKDIGALKHQLPAVELGSGDAAFCEVWLGQMEAISAGCSETVEARAGAVRGGRTDQTRRSRNSATVRGLGDRRRPRDHSSAGAPAREMAYLAQRSPPVTRSDGQ